MTLTNVVQVVVMVIGISMSYAIPVMIAGAVSSGKAARRRRS